MLAVVVALLWGARALLERQLAASVNRQLRGHLHYQRASLGMASARLDDVELFNEAGQRVLLVPRAFLRYHLWGAAVDGIVLEQPQADVVLDSSGQLNLASVLKPRQRPLEPGEYPLGSFRGLVELHGGRIRYHDERAPSFGAEWTDVQGAFDLSSIERGSGRLTARQDATTCAVEASWRRNLADLAAHVDIEHLALMPWTDYALGLYQFSALRLSGGTASLHLLVSCRGAMQDWGRSAELSGEARCNQVAASARQPGVQLRNGHGHVQLSADMLHVTDFSAQVNGDTVSLHGRLFNRAAPQLDMVVAAQTRDVGSTLKQLGVTLRWPAAGAGEVTATLRGALRSPHISGLATASRLSVAGHVLNAVRATFDWLAGGLELRDVLARADGSELHLSGWFFPNDGQRLVLQVKTADASLRAWLGAKAPGGGRASLDATVLGTPGSPLVIGRGQVHGVSVQGLAVGHGSGAFVYDAGGLLLSDVSAQTPYGSLVSPFAYIGLSGASRVLLGLQGHDMSGQMRGVDVRGGRLALVVGGTRQRWFAAGHVSDARVQQGGNEIRGVTADIAASPDEVWVPHAGFDWQGQPVLAAGFVGGKQGDFDVSLRASRFAAKGLVGPALEPGTGPLSLRALGTGSAWYYDGFWDAPRADLFVEGTGSGHDSRGVFVASRVDATLLNGAGMHKFHPHGHLDVAGAYAASSHGLGFNALGHSYDLRVGGFRYDAFQGVGATAQGALRFDALDISGPGGHVRLAGQIPLSKGRWDVDWLADHLPLEHLPQRLDVGPHPSEVRRVLKMFSLDSLEGYAYGEGRLSGPKDHGVLTGHGSIDEAVLHQSPLVAQAVFDSNKSVFHLRRGDIDMQGDRVRSHGDVIYAAGQPMRLALDLATSHFDLAHLLAFTQMAGQASRGWVEGVLHVGGRAAAPTAAGHLSLHDAVVAGQRIDEGQLDLVTRHGEVVVQKLTARVGPGTLRGGGLIDQRGAIAVDLSATKFPLQQIAAVHKLSPEVGEGDLMVRFRGTRSHPTVGLSIDVPAVQVNGHELAAVRGEAWWAPPRLTLQNLALLQKNGGLVSVNGAIRVVDGHLPQTFDEFVGRAQGSRAPTVDLALQFDRASLSEVAATFGLPWASRVGGSVVGTAKVSGILARPHLSMDVRGTQVYAGNAQLGSVDARLDYDGATHRLQSLQARSQGPAGAVQIEGSRGAHGPTVVNGTFKSFDISALKPFVPWSFELAGRLDSSFHFSGPLVKPTLEGAFRIATGQVASLHFDQFTGAVHGKDNVYALESWKLASGTHQALLSGSVPLQWDRSRFIFPGPVDIHGSIQEDSLDVLSLLVPEMLTSPGSLHASFEARGVYPDIHWNADLSIANGTIQNRHLSVPIDNLEVQASINDRQLTLKHFSGTLGKGSFQLSGGASVQGFALSDMAFTLYGHDLSIKVPDLLNSVDDVSMRLTGSSSAPQLGGHVRATSATVSLPAGALAEASRPRAAPLQLPPITVHLVVDLGDRTWLHFLNSTLRANGELNIAGTWPDVFPAGVVSLRSGQLQIPLLPLSLRLVSGRAVFTGAKTWLPDLEATATGTMAQYDIYVDVHGSAQNPQLRLSSNPPLSQQQIKELLLGGVPRTPDFGGLPGQPRVGITPNAAWNVAQAAVLQSVASSVGRLIGFSEVMMEFIQTGGVQYSLYRSLDPNYRYFLVFSTLQGVTQQLLPHDLYGLEWRFVTNQLVRFSSDDRGAFHIFYQSRYRF
jgi:autotransporter translocation and assembly factor TamB